jgi:amino acid transporter
MSTLDTILGRPLANSEARGETLSVATGIPTFGLDALSSAAYGPEAALTVLLPLGAVGLVYILPLTAAIVVLLGVVFLSYRQTIAAYPNGGGSYTVARANLGTRAGLLAGAALMTDYVLNVAVGISAGVGAIISAAPRLQPYTLPMCIAVLLLLTIVNLRGIREAGVLFVVPTCLFVLSLIALIIWGASAAIAAGGHPLPVVPPAPLPSAAAAAGWWIVLRAFASGCAALTGVEAVSNGVQAFQEPRVVAARRTLFAIIAILMVLLLGIAYLARAYGIGATPPGTPQYQSVLSQLIAAVAGRGALYWISMISILLVVSLSANTSFADFPRLCRAIADDGYLPYSFSNQGRRLVYTEGIVVLAVLAALLLIAFDGITDRLIPLFALGAFLAFTLSQAGMVAHWRSRQEPGAKLAMVVNGVGAAATGATVVILVLVKFTEGGWVVVVLVPALILVMLGVHRHYRRIERKILRTEPITLGELKEPIVIVPILEWNSVAEYALRLAVAISDEVEAIHIEIGDASQSLKTKWGAYVEAPARAANLPVPRLTVLKSPFRYVVQPIVDHVLATQRNNADRTIAVLVPRLIESHLYNYFLHNQRAALLASRLLGGESRRIVIVTVPWYLDKPR